MSAWLEMPISGNIFTIYIHYLYTSELCNPTVKKVQNYLVFTAVIKYAVTKINAKYTD